MSPVVVARTVHAGAAVHVPIEVDDQTAVQSYTIAANFVDFVQNAGHAGERFTAPDNAPRSAAAWLHVDPQSHKLAAGKKRIFHVTIRVPAQAAPGAHYAALELTTVPSAKQSGVNIRTQVHVLFLLTVAGHVTHDVRVRIQPAHRLVLGANTSWKLTVRNDGTSFAQVDGAVTFEPAFGDGQRQHLQHRILLPGSTATQTFVTSTGALPNHIQAHVHFAHSAASGVNHVDGAGIYVLPWWLIVVLALLVIGVVAYFARRTLGDRGESSNIS